MEEERIRAVIIDADAVYRGGLEYIFAQDDHFDLAASVARPAQIRPDAGAVAVVIDPAPRRARSEALLTETTERLPNASLLVYTAGFDGGSLLAAVHTGVKACLLKTNTPGEAWPGVAILAVEHGLVVVDEDIGAFFGSEPSRLLAPALAPAPGLSPREREVLKLAAEGLFDDEIGQRFGTSPNTVHNQMRSVVDKLGARNREHAVLLGVRYGIIDPYQE
jgi:DNA-binding NarL/FixJ family response regulator